MSISNIQKSDFAPWAALWRQYQATVHGRTSLSEDRVQDTFSRLVADDEPVHALVVRGAETDSVVGFIHFSLLATCGSRKPICWALGIAPLLVFSWYFRRELTDCLHTSSSTSHSAVGATVGSLSWRLWKGPRGWAVVD